MTEESGDIRYSGVRISNSHICRLKDEATVLEKIPREHIKSIKVCFDTPCKNPFCQYFAGFILLFLGAVGMIVLLLASRGGAHEAGMETGNLRLPLLPVLMWVMAGSGLWLLIGVFRARYHLIIQTEDGTRKIFFEKAASRQGIRQFIRKGRLDFGYEIDDSTLDAAPGAGPP